MGTDIVPDTIILAVFTILLAIFAAIRRKKLDWYIEPSDVQVASWRLRALSIVCLFFTVLVLISGLIAIHEMDRSHSLSHLPGRMQANYSQLSFIADCLKSYHSATGRYPTNDEGLLAARKIIKDQKDKSNDHAVNRLRVRESGVLTEYGDPFIYENRRGLDVSKFQGSGATEKKYCDYSILVDDGIYIWSLTGRNLNRTWELWHPRLILLKAAVFTTAVFFFTLYILLTWRSIRSSYRREDRTRRMAFALLLEIGIGLFFVLIIPPIFERTGYIGIIKQRTPELTKEYATLIGKYRGRGIISEVTYKKITSAMESGDDRGYY